MIKVLDRYMNIECVQNFHFKFPVLTSQVLYLLRTYIPKVLMLINVLFLYLHVQQVNSLNYISLQT